MHNNNNSQKNTDHFKKNININKKHIKLCFCNNRVIEINFEIV